LCHPFKLFESFDNSSTWAHTNTAFCNKVHLPLAQLEPEKPGWSKPGPKFHHLPKWSKGYIMHKVNYVPQYFLLL
jgi:hypothetical protein